MAGKGYTLRDQDVYVLRTERIRLGLGSFGRGILRRFTEEKVTSFCDPR